MDKILIRNLRARGKIGMSDKERSAPQELLLNVDVCLDTRKAGQCDELSYSIDYSKLTKDLLELVEANTRHTVEALAEDLATHCLRDPLTKSVKIRLEKTSAVRFTDAVGVEIFRRKETA
ncbi:MAG: dihydroneopterin aldolase [Chloroflexi bacterium]|nr:dihydroneopterin aldolase [Chloroflexota bacterium]NMA13576.1 dihydroneopterin aldolase [Chloroflexota bacterium]